MTPADLRTLISCIDLTSLNDHDSLESITALCQQAMTPQGPVAAVCIYPAFVSHAWQCLMETPVKIATVVNFPTGNEPIETVTNTIQQAILDGATEIDIVIPKENIKHFIRHCKNLCGNKALLKVILETGNKSLGEIEKISTIAIEQDADFLKTSTGKINIGATPEAAEIILNTIKKLNNPNKLTGFKASGGIRTLIQAKIYIDLIKNILGTQAFHPSRFRIGASSLLEEILCAFPNQS